MYRLLLLALALALLGVAGVGHTATRQYGVEIAARAGVGKSVFAVVLGAAIAAGEGQSCALTRAGGVKCWGDNAYGQLGDGSSFYRLNPVDVSGLSSGVRAIAAGGYHTCALTAAGGVKCWGWNVGGQLGDGTTANRSTAVDVSGLNSGAIALDLGYAQSCALTAAGGAKCWGYNAYGELGDGTSVNRLSPVDVSGLSGGVRAIAAGGNFTCALTAAGGVKCWGHNALGQLGDGTTISRATPVDVSGLSSGVIAIAAGDNHTCALTSAGGVKCWGWNWRGQLGDGTSYNSRPTPVDVSGLSSGVIAIAAGGEHTCALTSAGGVKCWGYNVVGQLGDGTRSGGYAVPRDVLGLTSDVTAIAAGGGHNCALTSSGGVKCWGDEALRPVEVIGFGTPEASLVIASRSVTVTRAATAAIKLRCGAHADCRGTLTLTTSVKGTLVGSPARRVPIKLGSRTFSIAAGRTQMVNVELTARGFKLLARAIRLPTQVRINYQQPNGSTTVKTRTITLRSPLPEKR